MFLLMGPDESLIVGTYVPECWSPWVIKDLIKSYFIIKARMGIKGLADILKV